MLIYFFLFSAQEFGEDWLILFIKCSGDFSAEFMHKKSRKENWAASAEIAYITYCCRVVSSVELCAALTIDLNYPLSYFK